MAAWLTASLCIALPSSAPFRHIKGPVAPASSPDPVGQSQPSPDSMIRRSWPILKGFIQLFPRCCSRGG